MDSVGKAATLEGAEGGAGRGLGMPLRARLGGTRTRSATAAASTASMSRPMLRVASRPPMSKASSTTDEHARMARANAAPTTPASAHAACTGP